MIKSVVEEVSCRIDAEEDSLALRSVNIRNHFLSKHLVTVQLIASTAKARKYWGFLKDINN